MTEEKKQGFFAKLFGGRRGGCCCNVRIEEVSDSEPEKPENVPDDERITNDDGKPAVESASRRTSGDRGGHRA